MTFVLSTNGGAESMLTWPFHTSEKRHFSAESAVPWIERRDPARRFATLRGYSHETSDQFAARSRSAHRCWLPGSPANAAPASARTVDDFALLDQDGKFHHLYYLSDAKAVVLMTHDNECPATAQSVTALEAGQEQLREPRCRVPDDQCR